MDCSWKKPKGTKLKYINRSVSNRPIMQKGIHYDICIQKIISKSANSLWSTTISNKKDIKEYGLGGREVVR